MKELFTKEEIKTTSVKIKNISIPCCVCNFKNEKCIGIDINWFKKHNINIQKLIKEYRKNFTSTSIFIGEVIKGKTYLFFIKGWKFHADSIITETNTYVIAKALSCINEKKALKQTALELMHYPYGK